METNGEGIIFNLNPFPNPSKQSYQKLILLEEKSLKCQSKMILNHIPNSVDSTFPIETGKDIQEKENLRFESQNLLHSKKGLIVKKKKL